VFIAHTDVF
jgi:hypothetical protein